MLSRRRKCLIELSPSLPWWRLLEASASGRSGHAFLMKFTHIVEDRVNLHSASLENSRPQVLAGSF
jgi:hypothetical protein